MVGAQGVPARAQPANHPQRGAAQRLAVEPDGHVGRVGLDPQPAGHPAAEQPHPALAQSALQPGRAAPHPQPRLGQLAPAGRIDQPQLQQPPAGQLLQLAEQHPVGIAGAAHGGQAGRGRAPAAGLVGQRLPGDRGLQLEVGITLGLGPQRVIELVGLGGGQKGAARLEHQQLDLAPGGAGQQQPEQRQRNEPADAHRLPPGSGEYNGFVALPDPSCQPPLGIMVPGRRGRRSRRAAGSSP